MTKAGAPTVAEGRAAQDGAAEGRVPVPCQLVVDVGNTDTVFGLVSLSGDAVLHNWRVRTYTSRTIAECCLLLHALLRPVLARGTVVKRGVVGSVVPAATSTVASAVASVVEGPLVIVNADSELPIVLDVEEPMTVGVDRIVNTLAAKVLFGRDTIVVDLGTATTFDCITAQGVFKGGVITPGIGAGLDWLATRTAQLPRVELTPPNRVVGRRTADCIRSGVFHSAVSTLDGIVTRLKEEWSDADSLLVVATGGFASLIAPHASTVDRIEHFLTLQGLAIAGTHLTSDDSS